MAIHETNSGPELLIRLRRQPGSPALGRQLESGLRSAIRTGRLEPGQRLPPSRTLAADLGVSRRLIVEAFEQLAVEGWLTARVGAGTFVRDAPPYAPRPASLRRRPPPPYPRPHQRCRFDFFPGHPDLGAFPRQAWAHATRDALRELPDSAFGYGDPRGLRELRVAIAAMLARVRGVICEPRQVIVCQGAVQALNLLVRAAASEAVDSVRVATEDPYLPEHRDVLSHAGAEVIPVPVDEFGVHDEAVAAARATLALVTPAHQCPTGAVLSAGRRAALTTWANREGTLIIEDDYDAEYRYDRAPVAALQALAPDRVAYLGSVSKTLAPALRLAWIVMPDNLLESVIAAKRHADAGSPVLEQAALARLITSGRYDRHVRSARRSHKKRRDALIAAIGDHLPRARVEGAAAGLHALARLERPVNADALVAAARRRDVEVYPLSFWQADPPPQTTAVVLGYGALHPESINQGVRRLANAWREVAL